MSDSGKRWQIVHVTPAAVKDGLLLDFLLAPLEPFGCSRILVIRVLEAKYDGLLSFYVVGE